MRKLAFLFIIGAITLGGCATMPKSPKIVSKAVPVPCLSPDQIPKKASLPISTITLSTSIPETLKKTAASIAILQGENQKLFNLLTTCANQGPSKKKK